MSRIINILRVVVDLGCGDGQIYEHFVAKPSEKVKRVVSYDLLANKPFIKAADIANLPRKALSCDVAVFSLSLYFFLHFDKEWVSIIWNF